MLCHKNIELYKVNISKSQALNIITSLNSLSQKPYELSAIPAILQVFRFLSRAYSYKDSMGKLRDEFNKQTTQENGDEAQEELGYNNDLFAKVSCDIVEEF
jgi:hypothetical protein